MTQRRKHDSYAQELIEAGRAQPPVQYDVDVALARHQRLLREGAPLSDWAVAASTELAPNSPASWLAMKAPLIGAISVVLAGVGFQVLRPESKVDPGPPAQSAETTRASAVVPEVTSAPISATDRDPPVSATRGPAHTPGRDHVRRRPGKVGTTVARGEPASSAPAPAAAPQASVPAHSSEATEPSAQREPVTPDDILEMRELSAAETLLSSDPARALALAKRGDLRFPRGYFHMEREYVAIMALIKLGRIEQARSAATRFLRSHPDTSYAERIHRALE